MSHLVGNPEDRFSHDAAHFHEGLNHSALGRQNMIDLYCEEEKRQDFVFIRVSFKIALFYLFVKKKKKKKKKNIISAVSD